MNVFAKLLLFLQKTMDTPESYGAFHMLSALILIGVTLLLCMKLRDSEDKTVRRILFVAWITIVGLEIYKQVIFTFDVTDAGAVVGDFSWYAFPFQLCSTPLYVLPLAIFLKDGRLRDAAIAYLCTFSLFGGLAVMFYPNDVFVSTIGINIQTMIHHGTQVALGIFLAVRYRRRLSLTHFLSALPIFATLVTTAMLLNIGVHNALLANGQTDTFNMFFVSPYHPCTLPVLSSVYELVPYPAFLFIYLIGFTLVAAIVYFTIYAITVPIRRNCHAEI